MSSEVGVGEAGVPALPVGSPCTRALSTSAALFSSSTQTGGPPVRTPSKQPVLPRAEKRALLGSVSAWRHGEAQPGRDVGTPRHRARPHAASAQALPPRPPGCLICVFMSLLLRSSFPSCFPHTLSRPRPLPATSTASVPFCTRSPPSSWATGTHSRPVPIHVSFFFT